MSRVFNLIYLFSSAFFNELSFRKKFTIIRIFLTKKRKEKRKLNGIRKTVS